MTRWIGIAAVVLVLMACSAAKAEQVLVIDSWWSGDYAYNGCGGYPKFLPQNPACALEPNPRLAAFRFEDQIMTQLAINPNCRGITYTRYHPDRLTDAAARAMRDPHWTLMIDYTVGAPTQSWTLN
jgi:hypothetical protein